MKEVRGGTATGRRAEGRLAPVRSEAVVSLPLRCRPQGLSLHTDLHTDAGSGAGADLRSGLQRWRGGGRRARGSRRRGIGAATGGALTLLVLSLALLLPLAPALALSLSDLPAAAPSEHVLDQADVLSRAGRAEIERQLQELASERVDARLVTVSRLDYGLDLSSLADQLLERWSQAAAAAGGTQDPLLLLLIDTQTRAAAVVAAADLQRQLPASLLRSTARTTMAVPLRDGDRQRQAAVDALTRLRTVLQGGEDPGEPAEPEPLVATSNVPSQEETRNSNAFTWVVVLLVVGSVVPMLTWWVFSR